MCLVKSLLRRALLFPLIPLIGIVPLSSASPPLKFPEAELDALLKLAPPLSPNALEAPLLSLERLEASGARGWLGRAGRHRLYQAIHRAAPVGVRATRERVLFEERASHGKNSRDNLAVRFSNAPNSLMSSLGAFLTGDTYRHVYGETRFVVAPTGSRKGNQ
jgi:hypothetical protein